MDDKAGPSNVKRKRYAPAYYKEKLTDEQLEAYLYSDGSSDLYELSESESDGSSCEDGDASDMNAQDDFAHSFTTTPVNTQNIENLRQDTANNSVIWSDVSTEMEQFPFLGEKKLLFPVPPDAKPIDFLNMIADNGFYGKIVDETNAYARDLFLSETTKERSRICDWKDVSTEELRTFFGLMLHMGTIQIKRMGDYWKKDPLFNFTCFSSHMSRNRFLLILRSLHFVSNPKENDPEPEDRLYKVRFVVDYFNSKMAEIYAPGKELSLDESMVLWRGRLFFRQYIPGKRHKYGIKLYVLTEPNGLLLNTLVYTGAVEDVGGNSHSANVVLKLMEGKLNKGETNET